MLEAKNISYQSVSDLSRSMNKTLEENFREVFVEGEISEVTRAASGHLYFTLKDEKSQLSCVMWKGMLAGVQFQPKPGLRVLCHGKPNIYNVSGRLQLVMHFMSLAGEGALQKKFLELKAKLEKEGLFSPERKRKIPFFPGTVGVVTSPSGAVIHDIMVKISERMPSQNVVLIGVRVQGEGAAKEIADAIEHFNSKFPVDVIIVARGGGSLEDLWAFNEEVTVRAIFASRIPVVVGVGHEIDITLADLAADVRAPTPTAAAEMVVPKRDDLLKLVNDYKRRLSDFERWFMPLVQRLDELQLRLNSTVTNVFQQYKLKLEALNAKVKALEPSRLLALLTSRIDGLRDRLQSGGLRSVSNSQQSVLLKENRLKTAITTFLINKKHRLEKAFTRLEAINPKKVLERGFSIAESKGRVIKSSAELKVGENLEVRFFEGGATTRVEKLSQ